MNVEVGSFGRKESHWMRFTWIFDKVLNMRLLNKMRTHGITEKIRAWIEDWLTGRSDNSQIFQPDVLRNRRNSTTVMNRHSQIVPSSPVRIPSSRLHQIKQEEGMDLMNRETAHESNAFHLLCRFLSVVTGSLQVPTPAQHAGLPREMEAESQPKRLFQGTASMLPSDPSHSPERGPCPVQSGDVFLSLSTDCLDGNISNGNSGQDSLAKCNAVRVSPVATSDPCLSFTTDPECPPK
ncbi:protein FAM122B isoform X22 [Narcine bancroftii]|uniref:protein FAM122B isoform X22 n=1 Tax=Narcine bancroftii TaxID=1343680 RepID=UPI0038313140